MQSTALDEPYAAHTLTSSWIDFPDCAHVQTVLYPDQPYWGDHIRALNRQAWVYQRTFTLPQTSFQRARLRFEAVDYFAQVWVNDCFAGEHEGGFSPFELEITSFLRAGKNTLTVRVSAPWDKPNPLGTYPTDHVIRGLVKGLYEHGEGVIPPDVNPIGIWRPVYLLLDQGVSIDHLRIRTELSGRVEVRVRATNSTTDQWCGTLALKIDALNHTGEGAQLSLPITLEPGTHPLDHTIQIPDVHLWWSWDHGSPELYNLEASLIALDESVVSVERRNFGVRTVTLERSPDRFVYRLNDRPVYIRGASYMPALYLSQTNDATFARDLALARGAHLNLLRVHVHVSPPELYDQCDAAGMLVWQDFELSWIHQSSPEFEQRARGLQRNMIDQLDHHPSIMTWTCHNEPTMLFTQRQNLERSPDPALYADAIAQDSTRPVFICSGQMDDDWQRAGDSHSYYGALWSPRYTDIFAHHPRLNTEFGVETPADESTLRLYPTVWERLNHLEGKIKPLWAYQAALIQTHVEHFRRIRAKSCAGYIQFWLSDLVPQVGCGVLDSRRIPKDGYDALSRASQPLLSALEHDGKRPIALWVFNDTLQTFNGAVIRCQVRDETGAIRIDELIPVQIAANASQRVAPITWEIPAHEVAHVSLRINAASGEVLSENEYDHPFKPLKRPDGYPWKFDPVLGTKVFDRPGAPSLTDLATLGVVRVIPLRLREAMGEWIMRQRIPSRWLSLIARTLDQMRR